MSEDDSCDGTVCDTSKIESTTPSSEHKPFTNESSNLPQKMAIQEEDQEGEKAWNGCFESSEANNHVVDPKCASSKKSKGQLKNYLQATRRRKAPLKAAKNGTSRPATSYYPAFDANNPDSTSWYNYRNLFGRNFSLTPATTKMDDYSQAYAQAYGYNQNAYSYQGWDFDRSKSEEETYGSAMGGSSALDTSQLNYSLSYASSSEYNSAYEAYSAAVAAAAVVAAASGHQHHCGVSTTEYSSERDSYDGVGGVHVIRSPIHYAPPSMEPHNPAVYPNGQAPPFGCYVQHKEEGGDTEGDMTSKMVGKTDTNAMSPNWFQQGSGVNCLQMVGSIKSTQNQHHHAQMLSYQQQTDSTTDSSSREVSQYVCVE